MLRNSISADMKVLVLQLKQKSTVGVSYGILQQLLSRALSRAPSGPFDFKFSLFPGQLFISHETIVFLHKFLHSRVFQFGLSYPFL